MADKRNELYSLDEVAQIIRNCREEKDFDRATMILEDLKYTFCLIDLKQIESICTLKRWFFRNKKDLGNE